MAAQYARNAQLVGYFIFASHEMRTAATTPTARRKMQFIRNQFPFVLVIIAFGSNIISETAAQSVKRSTDFSVSPAQSMCCCLCHASRQKFFVSFGICFMIANVCRQLANNRISSSVLFGSLHLRLVSFFLICSGLCASTGGYRYVVDVGSGGPICMLGNTSTKNQF